MSETKNRIWLWDNVKALLILSVVAGHFVTQFTGSSELMRSLFIIIYTFHMPLFIFVSGMFAKSSVKDGAVRVDRIISYLLLYVLLKAVIYAIDVLYGKNAEFELFREGGIPWYMLAMAVFIGLTYVLKSVKPEVLIALGVLLALVAGYDTDVGDVLILSRIIVFYPIFLLGFYTDSIKLAELTRKPILRAASAVLLICFVLAAFFFRDTLYELRPLLTARNPFNELPFPKFGAVYRLGHYLVGGVISFAVICILPNKKNVFSYVGAATLPIYFLHRPILYIIMNSGLGAYVVNLWDGNGIYLFLLGAVALTLLLSIKPLAVPFNKLMGCKYRSVLK